MKARGGGNKTEHSRRGPEANFPNRYYSLIFYYYFYTTEGMPKLSL